MTGYETTRKKDSVFLNQRSFFCLLPKILEILSSTVHDINICGESREICALWSSGFQVSPFLSKHDCAWAQEDFCTALSVNTVHRLIHKCNFKLFDLNKNKKTKRFLCPGFLNLSCYLSAIFSNHRRRFLQAEQEWGQTACYQHCVQNPASVMVWGELVYIALVGYTLEPLMLNYTEAYIQGNI